MGWVRVLVGCSPPPPPATPNPAKHAITHAGKAIAPIYEELASKYPQVGVFVCVGGGEGRTESSCGVLMWAFGGMTNSLGMCRQGTVCLFTLTSCTAPCRLGFICHQLHPEGILKTRLNTTLVCVTVFRCLSAHTQVSFLKVDIDNSDLLPVVNDHGITGVVSQWCVCVSKCPGGVIGGSTAAAAPDTAAGPCVCCGLTTNCCCLLLLLLPVVLFACSRRSRSTRARKRSKISQVPGWTSCGRCCRSTPVDRHSSVLCL